MKMTKEDARPPETLGEVWEESDQLNWEIKYKWYTSLKLAWARFLLWLSEGV